MLEFPQFYSTAPKAPATLRGSLTCVNNFCDTCVNVDKSVEIGDFFKNKDEYVTFLSKNAFSEKTFESKWYWTGQKNGRQGKMSLEK